jgi:hypothetical protein
MPVSYHLEPMQPILDGILYDDMWHIKDSDTRQRMIARGVVWGTTFEIEGTLFAGSVIASGKEEAEKIADARGLGETVDGPYIEAI